MQKSSEPQLERTRRGRYGERMVDREAMARAHAVFDPIAAEHQALPDTDMGRMFSVDGLRVRGKVYAFVEHEGHLMLKLPAPRIDALVAGGSIARVIMRDREMREWVTVPLSDETQWAGLIDEARAFVDSITPRS
jgi:hypothetical protein